MANVLFNSINRDEAHLRLEQAIEDGWEQACCTENSAGMVFVWDEQPTQEEVERARTEEEEA